MRSKDGATTSSGGGFLSKLLSGVGLKESSVGASSVGGHSRDDASSSSVHSGSSDPTVFSFHSDSDFVLLQQQYGTFIFAGALQKKSHSNRHEWHSRFCIIFDKALLYWPNDAITRAPRGLILTSQMTGASQAAEGKGSDRGARVNLNCSDGSIYAWIVGDGAAGDVRAVAKQWTEKLTKTIQASMSARPRPSIIVTSIKPPPLPQSQQPPPPPLPKFFPRGSTSPPSGGATISTSKRVVDDDGDDTGGALNFSLVGKRLLVEGVLAKKSTFNRHRWQKRWFVLTPLALVYYVTHKERTSGKVEPAKVIACDQIKRIEVPTSGKGTEAGLRFNLELATSTRVFELTAETAQAQEQWVTALRGLIDARSGAFAESQRRAASEREAALSRVRAQADLEKKTLAANMKANMDAEMNRLKQEHAARLESQNTAARQAQEARERAMKAESERATRERDAKIAQLEAERVKLEKSVQQQGAASSSSDARAAEQHAAALARVRADLASQKEQALLQARLEQEAVLQAARAAEQAKLSQMAAQVEEGRQQAESAAKAAYQAQAAALKASFEQEKETERRQREAESQANERRLVEKYERELETRKAEIARQTAAAEAEMKVALAKQSEAVKASAAGIAEREAQLRAASERAAAAQLEAERDARLKLESELVSLQDRQEAQARAEERAATTRREQQQAALKDQFKHQLADLQASLEGQLKAEQAARRAKEEEMARDAEAEKQRLTKELAKMEQAKREAEQKVSERQSTTFTSQGHAWNMCTTWLLMTHRVCSLLCVRVCVRLAMLSLPRGPLKLVLRSLLPPRPPLPPPSPTLRSRLLARPRCAVWPRISRRKRQRCVWPSRSSRCARRRSWRRSSVSDNSRRPPTNISNNSEPSMRSWRRSDAHYEHCSRNSMLRLLLRPSRECSRSSARASRSHSVLSKCRHRPARRPSRNFASSCATRSTKCRRSSSSSSRWTEEKERRHSAESKRSACTASTHAQEGRRGSEERGGSPT